MERIATQRAIWSCIAEKDVEKPTVNKESGGFYAKDTLAIAIPGRLAGSRKEAMRCKGGLYIACNLQ